MKKSTVVILLVVAAMLMGVVSSAMAAKERSDYYADIHYWLETLRSAINAGDSVMIKKALTELRLAVYAAMTYLASIGEYDSQLLEVIQKANDAVTKHDVELLTEAAVANEIVLGDVTHGSPESSGSHS